VRPQKATERPLFRELYDTIYRHIPVYVNDERAHGPVPLRFTTVHE
jgi:hypothetical protein